MTEKELRDMVIRKLIDNPGATVVRHKDAGGKICWRMRDKFVNPIMNFSDNVFDWLRERTMIKQQNEREWIYDRSMNKK